MLTNKTLDVNELTEETNTEVSEAQDRLKHAIEAGLFDRFGDTLIDDLKTIWDSSVSFRIQAKQLNKGYSTAIRKYDGLRRLILSEEEHSVSKMKDWIFHG